MKEGGREGGVSKGNGGEKFLGIIALKIFKEWKHV